VDACAICAPRLQEAVNLYRGKFLQEFFLADNAEFEEWALARREAFHQRALDALTDLANYYEQHGDASATRRCAMRALELDPWREPGHRQTIRVFVREGQTGAALAQYETCRRVLSDEMGVEPSSETRELFEKIRSGNWRLEVGITLQSPTSNLQLPTHLTPFIGRERELQDLGKLIGDQNCRWITLVGPGGMGKTRLAVQAASNQRNKFTQGVAFVPLVGVESADAIAPAIAQAVGFSFFGATNPRVQLLNYLRDKLMLLVLDNVEQLSSAADWFVELLQKTTALKLLMTSREPLNMEGEGVFPVEGLQIPEDDRNEKIESAAAVALFVQRAQRARVGFALSAQDRPNVARLCRLVDGTPLALELAATWVRTLSVAEIVKEIEYDLDFLRATVRDLPARHRSLRVVFDHSWELLTAEEQKFFLRLAVFRGGFRREAAEQIAGATLASVSALVAKSLVRRSGENRYDLHELVRQFAAEHLAENHAEQTATQDRHGNYYLTYFGQQDTRLQSAAQRETLAELSGETDNFRAAWDWAIAQREFALIEQTMRVFAMLFDTRGWLHEGLAMLGRAISALEAAHGKSPSDRTNQVALAHILIARALLASRLGQLEHAQTMLERSLDILRPLNEPRVLVEAITFLGTVMEFVGNYALAMELYAEGLAVAKSIGDQWFAALCLLCLAGEGHLKHSTGTPESMHAQIQIVVAEWRRIGDPRITAIALNNLSLNAMRLGRYDEARAALEESILCTQSIGDRWNLAFAYRGIGLIEQAQGNHRQAVDQFRTSLEMLADVGVRQDEARVVVEMSHSLVALGDDAEAERGWRKALRITTETQSAFVALDALIGIANLQARQGNLEHALDLAWIVLNHPASVQETKRRAEKLRAEIEARVTPQQVEKVQARARDESLEHVINQILGTNSTPSH
jgi:predicted ATPase/DNA-binding SARP family transcriptional activator